MPTVSPADTLLLALSTRKAADIKQIVLPKGKHGVVQMGDLLRQVASDRFRLASGHLQTADALLVSAAFRSCISRGGCSHASGRQDPGLDGPDKVVEAKTGLFLTYPPPPPHARLWLVPFQSLGPARQMNRSRQSHGRCSEPRRATSA